MQRRWSRIKTVLVAGGAVIGTIGVTVALVNDSFSLVDRFAADGSAKPPAATTSPSTSATTPATPRSSPSSRGTETDPAGVPACTSAAGEAIDCALPHRYELYVGACDANGLVTWLGGRDDVDVARGTASSSGDQCQADFKVAVTGSGAQALSGTDSSRFRKCFDERSRSVVTCAEPHTAEYVGAAVAGVADEEECVGSARDYLSIEISQRSSELRVRAIASKPIDGSTARCMIEIVGAERLAESVRGIGNAQLHWIP